MEAITTKGTLIKVTLTHSHGKFMQITAHKADNDFLPFDWMKLGEIHINTVKRLEVSGNPIRL